MKTFSRIVVLLLVPCLIANPSTATLTHSEVWQATPIASHSQLPLFTEQALIAYLLSDHRPDHFVLEKIPSFFSSLLDRLSYETGSVGRGIKQRKVGEPPDNPKQVERQIRKTSDRRQAIRILKKKFGWKPTPADLSRYTRLKKIKAAWQYNSGPRLDVKKVQVLIHRSASRQDAIDKIKKKFGRRLSKPALSLFVSRHGLKAPRWRRVMVFLPILLPIATAWILSQFLTGGSSSDLSLASLPFLFGPFRLQREAMERPDKNSGAGEKRDAADTPGAIVFLGRVGEGLNLQFHTEDLRIAHDLLPVIEQHLQRLLAVIGELRDDVRRGEIVPSTRLREINEILIKEELGSTVQKELVRLGREEEARLIFVRDPFSHFGGNIGISGAIYDLELASKTGVLENSKKDSLVSRLTKLEQDIENARRIFRNAAQAAALDLSEPVMTRINKTVVLLDERLDWLIFALRHGRDYFGNPNQLAALHAQWDHGRQNPTRLILETAFVPNFETALKDAFEVTGPGLPHVHWLRGQATTIAQALPQIMEKATIHLNRTRALEDDLDELRYALMHEFFDLELQSLPPERQKVLQHAYIEFSQLPRARHLMNQFMGQYAGTFDQPEMWSEFLTQLVYPAILNHPVHSWRLRESGELYTNNPDSTSPRNIQDILKDLPFELTWANLSALPKVNETIDSIKDWRERQTPSALGSGGAPQTELPHTHRRNGRSFGPKNIWDDLGGRQRVRHDTFRPGGSSGDPAPASNPTTLGEKTAIAGEPPLLSAPQKPQRNPKLNGNLENWIKPLHGQYLDSGQVLTALTRLAALMGQPSNWINAQQKQFAIIQPPSDPPDAWAWQDVCRFILFQLNNEVLIRTGWFFDLDQLPDDPKHGVFKGGQYVQTFQQGRLPSNQSVFLITLKRGKGFPLRLGGAYPPYYAFVRTKSDISKAAMRTHQDWQMGSRHLSIPASLERELQALSPNALESFWNATILPEEWDHLMVVDRVLEALRQSPNHVLEETELLKAIFGPEDSLPLFRSVHEDLQRVYVHPDRPHPLTRIDVDHLLLHVSLEAHALLRHIGHLHSRPDWLIFLNNLAGADGDGLTLFSKGIVLPVLASRQAGHPVRWETQKGKMTTLETLMEGSPDTWLTKPRASSDAAAPGPGVGGALPAEPPHTQRSSGRSFGPKNIWDDLGGRQRVRHDAFRPGGPPGDPATAPDLQALREAYAKMREEMTKRVQFGGSFSEEDLPAYLKEWSDESLLEIYQYLRQHLDPLDFPAAINFWLTHMRIESHLDAPAVFFQRIAKLRTGELENEIQQLLDIAETLQACRKTPQVKLEYRIEQHLTEPMSEKLVHYVDFGPGYVHPIPPERLEVYKKRLGLILEGQEFIEEERESAPVPPIDLSSIFPVLSPETQRAIDQLNQQELGAPVSPTAKALFGLMIKNRSVAELEKIRRMADRREGRYGANFLPEIHQLIYRGKVYVYNLHGVVLTGLGPGGARGFGLAFYEQGTPISVRGKRSRVYINLAQQAEVLKETLDVKVHRISSAAPGSMGEFNWLLPILSGTTLGLIGRGLMLLAGQKEVGEVSMSALCIGLPLLQWLCDRLDSYKPSSASPALLRAA